MITPRPRRQRLDLLLVSQGLAPSRERARALILAGQVRVAGSVVAKAGTLVDPAAPVVVASPDHPYVGRGGVKLARALDALQVPVEGRDALDVGASTGGFTDVLLQRGAASVVALDVGQGQLDWRLRTDPRVAVVERVNARTLQATDLPPGHRSFDLVTIDVAFISLRLVLPRIPERLRPRADVVALVKPQFEAGRSEVGKGGIVRDPRVQARAIDEVTRAADAIGFMPVAVVPCAIRGADGNQEYFLHLRLRDEADVRPGGPPAASSAAQDDHA